MDYIFKSNSVDNEYAKFVCKCFVVMNNIKDKYKIDLTTRQFDNIFIELANKKLDRINKQGFMPVIDSLCDI